MGCALSEPEKVLLPDGSYDHIEDGKVVGQFILKKDEELTSEHGGGPMVKIFYNVKFMNMDGSQGSNVNGVEDGIWMTHLGAYGEFQVAKTCPTDETTSPHRYLELCVPGVRAPSHLRTPTVPSDTVAPSH